LPESAPIGQIQVESRPESSAAVSLTERLQRPRPGRRGAILVDVGRGQRTSRDPRDPRLAARSPSPAQARLNRTISDFQSRLSTNVAEELGVMFSPSRMETDEQQPEASMSVEPSEVRMEDIHVSLTDIGDGVLHIRSHSADDEDDDIETAETAQPAAHVVWMRNVGTGAPSPRSGSRNANSNSGRRTPNQGVYIHRSTSSIQDQDYTPTAGSETPTSAPRLSRRAHVRSASSTTTLAQEEEAGGDIAGLTWSASGESLFIATTKSIVEWKIADFGRARLELGGGGDEWCEDGEEMAGQEMAWR